MPETTIINVITPAPQPVDVDVTQDPDVEIQVNPLGERGLQGNPGQDATSEYNTLTAVAGEALGGGKVVYIDNGKAYYYDPANTTLAAKVVGITNHAADMDDNILLITGGRFYHSGLGLTADTLYYVGTGGSLSTNVSGLTVIQKIGVAIDSDNILINFQSPIITI